MIAVLRIACVAAVLVVVLVLAWACDSRPRYATRSTPDGNYVDVIYVRDANSGRCMRVSGSKYTGYVAAPDRFCQGENLAPAR